MTGLLHRLAARANGSTSSVRSDARLPFAAAGLQETAPTLAAQAPQTEPMPLLQPAAPTSARPAQAAAAPAAVPSTPTPPSRLQQAPWQAPTPAPSAAPPAQPVPLHSGLEPLANDAPARPPATHAIRAQQEAAASLAKPLVPAAWPVEEAASAQSQPSQPPRDPAPLLPVHTATPLSAMPASPAPYARAATWAGSGPSTPREDTEVHIHIGRIDITAVHEAPKAKPRAREPAQPVSLQAYLAKRTSP